MSEKTPRPMVAKEIKDDRANREMSMLVRFSSPLRPLTDPNMDDDVVRHREADPRNTPIEYAWIVDRAGETALYGTDREGREVSPWNGRPSLSLDRDFDDFLWAIRAQDYTVTPAIEAQIKRENEQRNADADQESRHHDQQREAKMRLQILGIGAAGGALVGFMLGRSVGSE